MTVRPSPPGSWEVTGCSELAHRGFSQVGAKASAQDNYGIIACVCVCVYFTRTFLSSFLRSTLSHSAVCLKPVVPSVSSLRVCVCVCVLSFRRSEYIMQMRGRMRRKKQRVAVSRRAAKEGKWNGNECVCVCECVRTAVYICVFEHLPESCTVSH